VTTPSSEIEGRVAAEPRRTTLDATHSPERRREEANSDAAIGSQAVQRPFNHKSAGHKIIGKSIGGILIGILLVAAL